MNDGVFCIMIEYSAEYSHSHITLVMDLNNVVTCETLEMLIPLAINLKG